jgi:hypothetical protein
MPFCRKCGRRLAKYSESCPECRTSTTASLIKIKKATVSHSVTPTVPKKIAKAIIPTKPIVISVKVIAPKKAVKDIAPSEVTPLIKSIIQPKPASPTTANPPHEIIKSNVSLEQDIITNPQDYETQTFSFDLACPHNHFWPAGRAVIVSNGKGYCPRCGERLRKPKSKKSKKPPRSKLL